MIYHAVVGFITVDFFCLPSSPYSTQYYYYYVYYSMSVAMTEDGYEAHFQINHLSHFLLTLELLPVMLDTAESCKDCRIVTVSSRLHASAEFTPGNMNAEQEYSRTKFYSNSKLYNVRPCIC